MAELWGWHHHEYAVALNKVQAADAEETRRLRAVGGAQAYFNLQTLGERMRVAQIMIASRQSLLKLTGCPWRRCLD